MLIWIDYRNRSRALAQLIHEIAEARHNRREHVYSKSQRELAHPEGWWPNHLTADRADEQLLDCLTTLWEYPGLRRPGNLQLLRSKAYARSLERLLPLIDHQQVNGARAGNAEQVAAYQQTSQYVIDRINQLRGEQESTEHTTNVGLRIFDDAEPAVKRIEPAATSEDELDVPEFLKDGFQPANA